MKAYNTGIANHYQLITRDTTLEAILSGQVHVSCWPELRDPFQNAVPCWVDNKSLLWEVMLG